MKIKLHLLLFFLLPFHLFAQYEVQDFWELFCQGQYTPESGQVIVGVKLDKKNRHFTEMVAKAKLMQAYGFFYKVQENPSSLDSSISVLEQTSKMLGPSHNPKWKGTNEFWIKWENLRESLSKEIHSRRKAANNAAVLDKANQVVSEAETALEDMLSRILRLAFPASNPDGGLDPVKVTSEVLTGGEGCKFEVDILMTGEMRLEGEHLSPAALGFKDIYRSIPDWFESEVLRPYNIAPEAARKILTIEVNGHSDALLVNDDLRYRQQIGIPKGQPYLYVSHDDSKHDKSLEIPIANTIPLSPYSNEYLALSRAWIAMQEIDEMSPDISLIATEHESVGGEFRKVTITLFGETLFREYAKKLQNERKDMFKGSLQRIELLDKSGSISK